MSNQRLPVRERPSIHSYPCKGDPTTGCVCACCAPTYDGPCRCENIASRVIIREADRPFRRCTCAYCEEGT